MTESEIMALVKRMVKYEMAQMMLGTVTKTTDSYNGSAQRFSTDGEIPNMRIMSSYGLASRPPVGMTTVMAPVNGDPTHLMMLSNFDQGNRPILNSGESAVYGLTGQMVFMKANGDVVIGDYIPLTGIISTLPRAQFHTNGSFELGILKTVNSDVLGNVFLGSTSAADPAVLGTELSAMLAALITQLDTLLTALLAAPYLTTTPGNPVTPSPALIASVAAITSSLASIEAVYLTSPLTNILSQQVFLERILIP